VRLARVFTVLILLLSVAQTYGQKPSSPTARNRIASSANAAQIKPVVETDWRAKLVSNQQAPVKVIVFFDYQCPYCSSTIPALQEVLKKNSSQVQLILKHVPLSMHPDSALAHQAALALLGE